MDAKELGGVLQHASRASKADSERHQLGVLQDASHSPGTVFVCYALTLCAKTDGYLYFAIVDGSRVIYGLHCWNLKG